MLMSKKEDFELHIELQDTEWPFEYTDHDKKGYANRITEHKEVWYDEGLLLFTVYDMQESPEVA